VPEINSHQPYAELLKIFRDKVHYLKKEYHLEQRQIAAAIGEYPTNFSRYLDIRRDRPCSLKKLLDISSRLGDYYRDELAFKGSPQAARDMHSILLSIRQMLMEVNILLTAFTESHLFFVARLEKRGYSEVAEEWDRRLEGFSKWMKSDPAASASSTQIKRAKGCGSKANG
jgi:hypothetical protein